MPLGRRIGVLDLADVIHRPAMPIDQKMHRPVHRYAVIRTDSAQRQTAQAAKAHDGKTAIDQPRQHSDVAGILVRVHHDPIHPVIRDPFQRVQRLLVRGEQAVPKLHPSRLTVPPDALEPLGDPVIRRRRPHRRHRHPPLGPLRPVTFHAAALFRHQNPPVRQLDQMPLLRQRPQRLAKRHPGHAVALRQLGLRRQELTRSERSFTDVLAQQLGQLRGLAITRWFQLRMHSISRVQLV